MCEQYKRQTVSMASNHLKASTDTFSKITCTTQLTHCTMLTATKQIMQKLTLLSSSSRLVFSPGLIVEGVEEPLQLPLVCMSGGCFTGIGALSFWLHCSLSLLISSFPAY